MAAHIYPRRCALSLIAAALLGVATPAIAQQTPAGAKPLADRVLSRPPEALPRDCKNANMIELSICATHEFRQADKALNAAYQQARKDSDNDAVRAALLESQRAWIKLRDAACEFESSIYSGGSMSGLTAVNCLTRITRERTTYLQHAFDP